MSVFYPAHGEEGPFFEKTEEGQVEPEVEMPDPELAPEADAEEESGAGEEGEADADPGADADPEKPADA